MARLPIHSSELATTLTDALEMLRGYSDANHQRISTTPLPSLLEECEALCSIQPKNEPVRLIHHFACTGGTLISRCVATLPNTILISEIDPLSRPDFYIPRRTPPFFPNQDPTFRPTDLIMALRSSLRPVPESTLGAIFVAAVEAMRSDFGQRGQVAVIRDHPHSQFCTDVDPDTRPTVRELLEKTVPIVSVVTVRHPLDSFLALDAHGWKHFAPFTLAEYARRYHLFIDRHAGLPIIRYEDFIADPEKTLAQIAGYLGLRHFSMALDLFSIVTISGDSGRSSDKIGSRARRPIPDPIRSELERGNPLAELCARLGYDDDLGNG